MRHPPIIGPWSHNAVDRGQRYLPKVLDQLGQYSQDKVLFRFVHQP